MQDGKAVYEREIRTSSIFVTEGKLSPCQEERKEALKKYHLGVFVPQCKQDGNYEVAQCGKSGLCWCVGKDGVEVPNSRRVSSPIGCELRGMMIYFY